MLMFENGLLASFIPELLMVLAYLFCFAAPGFKTEKQAYELTPKVVLVTANHSFTVSVYKVSKYDFKSENQTIISDFKLHTFSKSQLITALPEYFIRTSSGQNSTLFCRPPPVI